MAVQGVVLCSEGHAVTAKAEAVAQAQAQAKAKAIDLNQTKPNPTKPSPGKAKPYASFRGSQAGDEMDKDEKTGEKREEKWGKLRRRGSGPLRFSIMHVVQLPCRVLYCILFMHAPIKDGKDARQMELQ